MVSLGTNLSEDLVDPPNSDTHLLSCSNHTRHIQDVEGLELSPSMKEPLENNFLHGSLVEHKSFEDIPFCGEKPIVKTFLFLNGP